MSVARDIEAAAAEWVMRREEPEWSAADDAQLQVWLEESYAHKAALWRLDQGWRVADRIGALGPIAVPATSRRPARPAWQWLAAAASLAVVLLAGPALLHELQPASQPTRAVQFKTPTGGHDKVALRDGSTVELDTATVIRTAVSGKGREVWVDKGEAFFSVVHTGVPFVVHAGPRLITVVGTKFSVSRDGDRVRVAVVEGTVRVSDADQANPTPEATITHGDLLQADGGSTLLVQNAEARVERSLAWRDGMLEFEQTALADAATQFNRYNQRKLVVSGNAAMIRIGGNFRASNVEAFARLLHDAYGLRVEYTPREMKVSGAAVTDS